MEMLLEFVTAQPNSAHARASDARSSHPTILVGYCFTVLPSPLPAPAKGCDWPTSPRLFVIPVPPSPRRSQQSCSDRIARSQIPLTSQSPAPHSRPAPAAGRRRSPPDGISGNPSPRPPPNEHPPPSLAPPPGILGFRPRRSPPRVSPPRALLPLRRSGRRRGRLLRTSAQARPVVLVAAFRLSSLAANRLVFLSPPCTGPAVPPPCGS